MRLQLPRSAGVGPPRAKPPATGSGTHRTASASLPSLCRGGCPAAASPASSASAIEYAASISTCHGARTASGGRRSSPNSGPSAGDVRSWNAATTPDNNCEDEHDSFPNDDDAGAYHVDSDGEHQDNELILLAVATTAEADARTAAGA